MAKKRKAITEDGKLIDAGEETAEAQDIERAVRSISDLQEERELLAKADAVVTRESKLRISQDDIDRCITQHEEVLCNAIRGAAPPADANILTLLQTIEALKALKPTVQ